MNFPSVILQGAFTNKAEQLATQLDKWKESLEKYQAKENPTAGDRLNWQRTERNIQSVEDFAQAAYALINQLYQEVSASKRDQGEFRRLETAVKDYMLITGITPEEARIDAQKTKIFNYHRRVIRDLPSLTDILTNLYPNRTNG